MKKSLTLLCKRFLFGAIILLLLLSMVSCVLNYRDTVRYYRDRDNYITATSTVDFINYADDGGLYIGFDEIPKGLQDDCFFIAGKNLDIVLERGIREKLQMGSEVTITSAPKIFGDGYVVPIAAIAVDGEELLSFEEGYPNLMEWLKKN